jgi:acetyl-CoA carboxylase biotin carboxyl carrier protein
MIDIRKLKELVRIMVANELTELDLSDSEQQVSIRRPDSSAPAVVTGVPGVQSIAVAPPMAAASPVQAAGPAASAGEEGLVAVESPMVGTFYSSPSPGKPMFVNVGDTIEVGTVFCLIEAMKIFNEIKAEQAGTVVEIIPDNGSAVEFGQTIMVIRPS